MKYVTLSQKRGPYASPAQIERRLKILQQTLELLRRDGLAGVTIKEVATRAGVAQKTIHNVFGGRDELLVQAASLQLDSIQISEQIVALEPGIPQLLSFTQAVMDQFTDSPTFMATIVGIVFKADDDRSMSQTRVRHIRQMTLRSLQAAARNRELRNGTDITALTDLVTGNQWGTLFLWIRELLSLEQFIQQTMINHCVTLIPFCTSTRKRWLEQELERLQKQFGVKQGLNQAVSQDKDLTRERGSHHVV